MAQVINRKIVQACKNVT